MKKKPVLRLALLFAQASYYLKDSSKTDSDRSKLSSSPLLSSYDAFVEKSKLLAPNVASMAGRGNIPVNYSTEQLNIIFHCIKS